MTSIWGALHFRKTLLNTPLVILLLLSVLFLISGIGAVNVSSYKLAMKFFLGFLLQCAAIYIVIDTKERILAVTNWWCLIYMLMGFITIAKGGMGPGDFTRDQNDAALALLIGIPWVFYSMSMPGLDRFQRWLRWLTLCILIAAVVVSRSRGGFLGLVAVMLTIWWFSQNRLRNAVVMTIGALVLGGVLVSVLPQGYIEEMGSISSREDSTRVERLRGWEVAWLIFKHNPIIGVGGGNFAWNVSRYQRQASWWTGEQKSLAGRKAHSLYFQVLADLGAAGAILYIYIIFVVPWKLNKVRNKLKANIDEERIVKNLVQILIASMVAIAVSGAFISVAYYPHIPIWVTMYAIVKRYYEQRLGESGHNI